MKLEYLKPSSVEETLTLLSSSGGKARIIAGGTDLIPDLRAGKHAPERLLDITGIERLRSIEISDDEIRLGAACTFAELQAHAELCNAVPALIRAVSAVGSPQTRNVATLGGNLVNAMPAADSAVPLTALGAVVEVSGADGNRFLPLSDCYIAFGKSAVDPSRELAISVRFARPDRQTGFATERFAQRHSVALPVVHLAVFLRREERTLSTVRIVAAPCGIRPWRAVKAEALLRDKAPSAELIRAAGRAMAAEAPFRDSPVRFTAKYKKELSQALFWDAMADALTEAGFPVPEPQAERWLTEC